MRRGKPGKHYSLLLQNIAISAPIYLCAMPKCTNFSAEPEVILVFFVVIINLG